MPTKPEVIVLVGPMGVGKTTVGRKLAKALKVPFVDTDALFIAKHGAIADYFENHGEISFRAQEELVLAQAISAPGVVATGGGAVLSELSRSRLTATTVVYLSTDGKHIASRIKNGNRPLLKNGLDDWQRIYDARKPIYESVCDFNINTSGQPLNATVAEIREKVGL